jgi:hypothetical protein
MSSQLEQRRATRFVSLVNKLVKKFNDSYLIGIASNWPTRKTLLDWFSQITPWSMDDAVAYINRADIQNKRGVPPHTSFGPFGARLRFKAQALALQGKPWEAIMRDALGYLMFADQLNYFWHGQFRILFPERSRPLRSMNWELMTETMSMAFVLGRVNEGIYQGYLTHAVLNQTYQLQFSYEERHRCGLAFMLRLFASWRGDVNHAWPGYAYDEPIYEAILELWREPDPEILKPWLLAACDRHTHQSGPETETVFYDFSSFPVMPLEILLLFRLRELTGLKNPYLKHQLMAAPFDQLPAPQSSYTPDHLVLDTLERVRTDWPNFQQAVSLEID